VTGLAMLGCFSNCRPRGMRPSDMNPTATTDNPPAMKHTKPRIKSCIVLSFEPASEHGHSGGENADRESDELETPLQAKCHLHPTLPIPA
jgi:hypothetical protein